MNDHGKSQDDKAQQAEQAHELTEQLNLLKAVDRRITPQHVAKRFRELLSEIEDDNPPHAPAPDVQPPGILAQPAGLAPKPRVLLLIDLDSVSHGLADGTPHGRASDQDVQLCLDVVQATARALDPQARVRGAASSATAAHHVDVLTASGNNQWLIRRGLDGADQALLEEMNNLIGAATRPARKRAARPADLVILVGQDHVYAPTVRRLRLLGIPTWLIVPGRLVAAQLYACSSAVSLLGRDTPDLTTGRQLTPPPQLAAVLVGSR